MEKENKGFWEAISKKFDFQASFIASISMGTSVTLINLLSRNESIQQIEDFERVIDSITAGCKQAVYTLLAAGLLGKLCKHYAEKEQPISAVMIPSIISSICTAIIHTLKGTPDPLNSVIGATVASIAGFWYWSKKKN